MYPKMKTDLKGQLINQVYYPDLNRFMPLAEDILDYDHDVELDPNAVMLKDDNDNLIPQAYDPDKKAFVPITNHTYLYDGGEQE